MALECWPSRADRRLGLRPYLAGAAAVAATLAIKLGSDRLIGGGPPLVVFAVAVTIAAWYGGQGPGLFAVALSSIVCVYLFFHPAGSFAISNPNDRFRLAIFIFEGALTSRLMGTLYDARCRAEEKTRERERAEAELRASEERYRLLVEGAEDYAIFMLSPGGRIESWNSGAERITGYRGDEVLGGHFSLLYTAEDVGRGQPEEDLEVAAARGRVEEEGWRVRKDGSMFWANVVITAVRDRDRALKGFAKITRDITERKRAEERLIHQGTHDALTGLPNRVLLLRKIDEAAGESGGPFALLLLDLDRFKEINDAFGHHFGDAVLQQLHPLLRGAIRGSDTVGRLGGDEFAILLPGSDRGRAESVATRVLAVLGQPIVVEGQPLDVGVSIGIALFPEHGRDAATLLRRADVAMYAAKRARSGRAVYDSDQADFSPRRLALAGELRRGIGLGELLLHYQPKVELSTMRPRGAEALARWRHPRDGLLGPGEFIPLAEHTGLIRPLGVWALRAAMPECLAWHGAGLDLGVAVNLAPENLRDGPLLATVADLLSAPGARPEWLTIEVTEGAMMAEPGRTKAALHGLHDLGVRLSIDDFGAGYSSLTYLKDLPVDEVKIDGSFAKGLSRSGPNACIVRSVIDLGHDLGLRVVAEGVEDRASLDLLASWGCDLAQGFHISLPLASADFLAWMAGWPRPAPSPGPALPFSADRPPIATAG